MRKDRRQMNDELLEEEQVGWWENRNKNTALILTFVTMLVAKLLSMMLPARFFYDNRRILGMSIGDRGVKAWSGSSATFGDATMYSFHATKVFNTIEGGAVCYHDSSLRPVLHKIRNFGITGPETVESVGGNAKMNEFCAAMGVCNLRHVDEEIAKRRKVLARYRENLSGIDGIILSVESGTGTQTGVATNASYMPVVFDESVCGVTRDEVAFALAKRNIYARKYFYPLISDYACYSGRFDPSKTPVAQWVAQRVLCLPMFADLDLDSVDMICDIIRSLTK